jgi:hypothetical protein
MSRLSCKSPLFEKLFGLDTILFVIINLAVEGVKFGLSVKNVPKLGEPHCVCAGCGEESALEGIIKTKNK